MNELRSLTAYSAYLAALLSKQPVVGATVKVWPESPYTGIAEGEVFLANGIRLRIREELDFADGLITHLTRHYGRMGRSASFCAETHQV